MITCPICGSLSKSYSFGITCKLICENCKMKDATSPILDQLDKLRKEKDRARPMLEETFRRGRMIDRRNLRF